MTIQGKESLFYIKYNGIWYPVGCLTSSPLSEESEMISTTTRDSKGWKTSFPTLQSYSINLDGLVTKDDADGNPNILSYRKLRTFKRNRTLIEWKIETEEGYFVDSGQAYIKAISQTDEVDSDITFQASLEGYGAPGESMIRYYVLGDGSADSVIDEIGAQTNLINTQNNG